MRTPRALVDILAALASFAVIGVALSWLSGYVPDSARLPAVVAGQGVATLAVIRLLLAWRGQRWPDIGLVRPDGRDWRRAGSAFGACLGVNILFIYALYAVLPGTVEQHSQQLGSIARQLAGGISLAGLVIVLAFVGVYEEVFARGFLLRRCRTLLGGSTGPVVISSVLFGLGHLYQGWIGVGQTTLIGLVLAILTLRWGSLWPAIIAHGLLDIVSVFLMRMMGGG